MRFADIIGQESVKQKLINSVRENRVAHAQLFLGAPGVGKLGLALAYAQYILCPNRTETDSCGVCPTCLKVQELTHPDLHFVFPTATVKKIKEPESDLFIEDWRKYVLQCQAYADLSDWYKFVDFENKQGTIYVRDAVSIIRKLSFKAYEGGYKIAVIWMSEKIRLDAANKLLKLLEEPPVNTLFILIAEDQEELLTTVRSRTVLVKIPKIDNQSMAAAFEKRVGGTANEIADAVALANGNWLLAKQYHEKEENEKLYFSMFQQWMRFCFKDAVPELIDFVGNAKNLGREKQKELLEYALNIFHNSLLINNSLRDIVALPSDELTFNTNFAPFVNSANTLQICNLFEEGIRQIERNGNASLILLDISLQVARLLRLK